MLELSGRDASWTAWGSWKGGAEVGMLPAGGNGPKLKSPDGEFDNDPGAGQMLWSMK